jgi:hypothetical protein
MDSRGTRDLRRFKKVSDYPTHPGGPETPRKLTALHISYKQRGQCDYCRQVGELDTNCNIQYLVYFVSEVLSDSKTWYFHIMKLGYALLIMSHKLSHYF